ncbi:MULTISPECIES: hypothetical protein [unclassified Agrobacterium]|uniref:hypothetical protein n=1 Tax=unclassified Agrobacterium TaxID=2632611 RepID=UPI00244C476D|nr:MULTISPECIES: hypothetical protein [unclassified Agrobacterium]MDH0614216.1 hypothetical protein [Agrobacterium sp. GD03872]MDH0695489.1 hypothetical protein [Agrobacterium sp. GD03871]MDH1058391.1 hypothetical protein [Agrobacterium sp. GD03992]MDH2209667.1 hypothetical protein [Agrobacterium sp. GD03643]MDH2219071.1 hypothetical protein [Agrobacterium sp. GD03638]
MVKVVLEDINTVVYFTSTPEWAAETQAWSQTKCTDHDTFWCRRITSNGGVQIRQQCRICGHLLGGARKREPGDENLPLHDPDMETRYNELREQEHLQILKKHARLQHEKTSSWFDQYNDYLASDEWQQKRKLVFKRSGGMCEGCGLAEAKQVHHLTYKHVGCEFLFELVAVCDSCHDRLHQDEAPETGDERASSAEPDNPDYEEPL